MNSDQIYHKKLLTIDQALQHIDSGQRIVAAMAAVEPQLLLSNLHQRVKHLKNVEFHCANPNRDYQCFVDKSLDGRIEIRLMFVTAPIKNEQGRNVHYIPQHLSRWSDNLKSRGKVDIFWGSCSLPDERGFVSLSLGSCYEPEMIYHADKVILEVNPNLPQTYGATSVSVAQVDYFIESSAPVPTLPSAKFTQIDTTIGERVADLIPDGATLQLGIGAIPNALAAALRSKRNLGIHTELLNDAMMQLYNEGVVTNRCKSIWPGKMVAAFVYGSAELYKFVDKNPMVELQPASVVNDPYRIGRNHCMFSINSAVEVDLTGQVCSESVGHHEISGVGGASDTHTGAQRSKGGRGIIAMRSTTSGEAESKIVFELKPGAKISISRNDVDTLVTEYGVAELRGRSVASRAEAMINIAHPKFREELINKAKSIGYL